jgi:drug/metabolite transporter (DMT)-like permease
VNDPSEERSIATGVEPSGARPAARGGRTGSVALALAAAFGWATYYLFVLRGTPGTAPSAILVYPFVVGGGAFALSAIVSGHGPAIAREWRSPSAYLRTTLMLGMQVSILAATYLTGPVDASLLSLIGDVVATPLIIAALFAGPRASLGRPLFVLGLLLSLLGGSLAIVGGRRLSAVHGLGWLAVIAVPIAVGFYFILSARASESAPYSAVVGQSMLGAALGALLIAPLIPGGWAGLVGMGPVLFALLAVNGLVSFFAAPTFYFLAIHREGIVVPSMLMTAIPIFTLLLSVGILGLALPWLGLLGIPIAVAGALLTLATVGASSPSADRWARPGR